MLSLLTAMLMLPTLFSCALAASCPVKASISALSGGSVTVSFRAGPVEKLNGVSLFLQYDPAVFSVKSAAPATATDADGDETQIFSGFWQSGEKSDHSGYSVAFLSVDGVTKSSNQAFFAITLNVLNGYKSSALNVYLDECTTCDDDETNDIYDRTLLASHSFHFTDADRFNTSAKNGGLCVGGYNFSESAFTVPSAIAGTAVTHLGENAFSGIKNACIGIPDSVTAVSDTAFSAANNNLVVCKNGSAAALYAAKKGLSRFCYVQDFTADIPNGFLLTRAYQVLPSAVASSVDATYSASFNHNNNAVRWGTGSTVRVPFGGQSKVFTLIQSGDLNGDGVCDVLDLMLAEYTVAGVTSLGTAAKKAADADGDDVLTASDYSALVNIALAR